MHPVQTAQRTILMIDDEESSRRLAKLLLEREGFRVVTAPNGRDGLMLAKVERPQVILLDIIMPKLNGYETLRRLKEDLDTQAIPVIVLTAKAAQHDIDHSFQLGAVFHVEKPYETQDLLKKITVAVTVSKESSPHPERKGVVE